MSEDVPAGVEGERGPAVVARLRSLNARVNQGLAVAVLGLVGGGFLFWYYTGLAARGEDAQTARKQATEQKTRAEMKLPPLVKPEPAPMAVDEETADAETEDEMLAEGSDEAWMWGASATAQPAVAYAGTSGPSEEERELQRQLDAPVMVGPGSEGEPISRETSGGAAGVPGGMAESLVPTATPGAVAAVMPGRRWVLPKGAFIDCTLETAIDSTLPGMTACVTAVDVFGADGRVVLLERGTKLVGEVRSAVRAGQRRVFVLWSEARTPTGVVAALASPGTDPLGRSGVTGEVDTHFAERFGAAILLSVLDAATVALVNAQQEGESTVVLSPQGSQEVAAEVIRSTVDVPPTIHVPQGARIQVFVARDVDFSQVYALKRRAG